jgi:hypothetical protein
LFHPLHVGEDALELPGSADRGTAYVLLEAAENISEDAGIAAGEDGIRPDPAYM